MSVSCLLTPPVTVGIRALFVLCPDQLTNEPQQKNGPCALCSHGKGVNEHVLRVRSGCPAGQLLSHVLLKKVIRKFNEHGFVNIL